MRRSFPLVPTLLLLGCAATTHAEDPKNVETEGGGQPISIEEAGARYLEANPAPIEIQADWADWAQRTGKEVWDRPGLTRAQRSLVTLAILTVLHEEGPLRVHVEAGLANGLDRQQIAEVFMHSAVYAGVPQALRSMQIAREVFDRLDAEAAAADLEGDTNEN